MDEIYIAIVDLIKKNGVNSKMEQSNVKTLKIKSGMLILELESGWLGLRVNVDTTSLSNQKGQAYFTKVLYKNKDFKYCALKEDLENILEQIVTR